MVEKKKSDKKRSFEIDEKTLQSIAAKSMMGLFPGVKLGQGLPRDFDLRYDLIFSAANHAELKFSGSSGDFKSPLEMRISIEHDPNITRTELAYNFKASKFIIYTKLTDADLDEIIKEPNTEKGISRGEIIIENFGAIIPSALLKYFTTQAEIMSAGKEEGYKKRFLPEQFKSNPAKLKTSKRRHKKS